MFVLAHGRASVLALESLRATIACAHMRRREPARRSISSDTHEHTSTQDAHSQ